MSFHPLRVMLRGAIDEKYFGERPDALGAATRVADRIGDDPLLALRAVREAHDLHDGLGPALSGIAFTADAARDGAG